MAGNVESLDGPERPQGSRVSLVPTPTGLPSMRVRRPQGGFASLHSQHDPWEEACRFAEAVELPADTGLVVVLGLGLGYHVLALAHRLRSLGRCPGLWAVELDDDVLLSCLQHTDLGLLFKLEGARLLSRRGLGRLRDLEESPPDFGVVVVRHPPSVGLAPQEYGAWESGIDELAARRRLKGRAPGLDRWLLGLTGPPVLRVREACRRVLEAGPPFGETETALLLLDRVHRYE